AERSVDLPVLPVVGRPISGKWALAIRVPGRLGELLEDGPGGTRDRVAYDSGWAGRHFTLVETGGWEPDARGCAARVPAQAERAVESADAVLLAVDATVGGAAMDEGLART